MGVGAQLTQFHQESHNYGHNVANVIFKNKKIKYPVRTFDLGKLKTIKCCHFALQQTTVNSQQISLELAVIFYKFGKVI